MMRVSSRPCHEIAGNLPIQFAFPIDSGLDHWKELRDVLDLVQSSWQDQMRARHRLSKFANSSTLSQALMRSTATPWNFREYRFRLSTRVSSPGKCAHREWANSRGHSSLCPLNLCPDLCF